MGWRRRNPEGEAVERPCELLIKRKRTIHLDRNYVYQEVDFVLPRRRDEVDAIECKWDPGMFDGASLKLFRSQHPGGNNYLVTPSGDPPYNKRFGDLDVRICTPSLLRP